MPHISGRENQRLSLSPANMAPDRGPSKRTLSFQVPSHRCRVGGRAGENNNLQMEDYVTHTHTWYTLVDPSCTSPRNGNYCPVGFLGCPADFHGKNASASSSWVALGLGTPTHKQNIEERWRNPLGNGVCRGFPQIPLGNRAPRVGGPTAPFTRADLRLGRWVRGKRG